MTKLADTQYGSELGENYEVVVVAANLPESCDSGIKESLERIRQLSEACQSRPTQKLAKQLCAETRNVWGDILSFWLRRRDKALGSFTDLDKTFEMAKSAAQRFLDSTDVAQSLQREYALHYLENIAWRLDLARILLDTNQPIIWREREINSKLDKVLAR